MTGSLMAKASKVKRKAYPQDPLGFYIEPQYATDALLTEPMFQLVGKVWDPCAGSGNILRACRDRGFDAIGSDIAPRVAEGFTLRQMDFLLATSLPAGVNAIICNPPYGSGFLARRFIEHALALRADLVAAFVELRFLGAARRHRFYRDNPPALIGILSRRPSCPPGEMLLRGEIEAKGGSKDYCWVVYASWLKGQPTQTVWLAGPADRKRGEDLPLFARARTLCRWGSRSARRRSAG